jgi:hypothetical protein
VADNQLITEVVGMYRVVRNMGNKFRGEAGEVSSSRRIRLWGSLALALTISIIFLAAASGNVEKSAADRSLSQSLAPGQSSVEPMDPEAIVSRTVEQRFNIQLVESSYPGEIPYSDVWVLNDPFFPLMGDVGALVDNTGILDSKLGNMLNRTLTEGGATTPTSAPATEPSSSVPVTAGVTSGQAVLVEDIYENRGIKYAKIKVGDTSYDRIKAGVSFADNYKITEFKSADTLVLMCGDETYELRKGQLRRI